MDTVSWQLWTTRVSPDKWYVSTPNLPGVECESDDLKYAEAMVVNRVTEYLRNSGVVGEQWVDNGKFTTAKPWTTVKRLQSTDYNHEPV
jgi:hypothetical protein